MYKISIKFRNNDDEYHYRLVKSMPAVGDYIRLSTNNEASFKFFHTTVKVVSIVHTAFIESYLEDYHKAEPHAIVIVVKESIFTIDEIKNQIP